MEGSIMSGTVYPSMTAGSLAKAGDVLNAFEWVTKDLVPQSKSDFTDATYSLGESNKRWKNIYFSQMILPATTITSLPICSSSDTTTGFIFPESDSCDIVASSVRMYEQEKLNGQVFNHSGLSYSLGIDGTDSNRFKISTGNTISTNASFTIHSTGSVSFPKHPAFLAYLSASLTSNIAVNYTLTCNTATLNIGGGFGTATSKFTAPLTGRYQFGVNFSSSDTYVWVLMSYVIDGVTDTVSLQQSFKQTTVFNPYICSLTAGQTIYPTMRTFTATTDVYGGTPIRTCFYGFYIGS